MSFHAHLKKIQKLLLFFGHFFKSRYLNLGVSQIFRNLGKKNDGQSLRWWIQGPFGGSFHIKVESKYEKPERDRSLDLLSKLRTPCGDTVLNGSHVHDNVLWTCVTHLRCATGFDFPPV